MVHSHPTTKQMSLPTYRRPRPRLRHPHPTRRAVALPRPRTSSRPCLSPLATSSFVVFPRHPWPNVPLLRLPVVLLRPPLPSQRRTSCLPLPRLPLSLAMTPSTTPTFRTIDLPRSQTLPLSASTTTLAMPTALPTSTWTRYVLASRPRDASVAARPAPSFRASDRPACSRCGRPSSGRSCATRCRPACGSTPTPFPSCRRRRSIF
mmetsp:Transcript_9256/g.29486  ORF Transcript_9256/g.29486 Transcript_9256/m.29486 type:complete len:206 (-) Transcript_9256:1098-1715(-)